MRYIVPSSRIVFADFMLLLVSVLIGLNSTMSFSDERLLPPVNLPAMDGVKETGFTDITRLMLTVKTKDRRIVYFLDNKEAPLWEITRLIKKSGNRSVVLRGELSTALRWEEYLDLISRLTKAGIKEISYGVTERRNQ